MNALKKFITFFKGAGTMGKISIFLCFVNFLIFVFSIFYIFQSTLYVLIIDGFLFMFCGMTFHKLTKKLDEFNSRNY